MAAAGAGVQHPGMASPRLQIGRRSEPGTWFSITTVAHRRRPVFAQPPACGALIRELHAVGLGQDRSLAWVVMPEHLHWLLELGGAQLPVVTQALKSRSARAVNAATGGSGPVWQAGYYDRRIRGEADLLGQARYILENPVRRGLVGRIEDYPAAWCAWPVRSSDL
jgi:REP element-mobilizing transposase RayT